MSAFGAASTRHLPFPLTSLIGRERECAEVRELLLRSSVRLLTLTGTGGTGKTRLAIAVAEQVGDAFPDGVTFVSLASIDDPTLVGTNIAQVLGVREAGDRSLDAGLKAALQTSRTLLILDSFEHLIEAANLVGELLATCPDLTILVTSRSVLHLYGEHDYDVVPLPLPDADAASSLSRLGEVDAVRLFTERARAARARFALTPENAPAVAAICARLDGLPLAIELAAARVRILSPQALLARLEHRLKVLTDGPRDVPQRQQTMRSTIAWSYDLLTDQQQAFLCQLAVFSGGWTIEAAEALGEDGSDVIDDCAALVDQSLIRLIEGPTGASRFGMLETIREFALERLAAGGESQTARRSHADYCLQLVDRHAAGMLMRVADQSAILRILDDEHDNLRSALDWLVQYDPDAALQMASNLWPYWAVRGLLS
jgi:predicted ATPase